MMMEKKLAPEMNVITRVRARIRGACCKRAGNMGYFAPFASHTQKAMSMQAPRIKGARTCADFHGYYQKLVNGMEGKRSEM
jgi:hypothetical protein